MKMLLSFFFALSLVSGASAHQEKIQDYELVPVESLDAYEDPENAIKATIEGTLPNECYGQPFVQYRRGKTSNTIYVQVYSFVQEGPCAQVVQPYTITADLGSYADGTYTVIVQQGTQYQRSDVVVVD